MKTLKAEKGKYLDLKPCRNCIPIEIFDYKEYVCPCPNHSGEIQRKKDKITGKEKITLFNCENRKMHQLPTVKARTLRGTSNERSKRKAN